jgi:hypothetical protein
MIHFEARCADLAKQSYLAQRQRMCNRDSAFVNVSRPVQWAIAWHAGRWG